MLRSLFVLGVTAVGAYYGLKGGPYYVLLLYLWIAYFRPEQWVWGSFIQQLNLSFATGVALVMAMFVSQERSRLRIDLRTSVLILFLVQSLVATMTSPHATYSWNYWPDLAKSLFVTYAVATLVSDKRRLRLAILVIGLSLGLEAAKQGWVQLLLNPGAKNVNRISSFGDENGAALAMFMLTPLLLALARTAASARQKWMHRFLAVGVIYRGIASYSRGGFLSAGVLGLLYFFRSRHKIRAAVAVIAFAVLVTTVFPDKFWERMETIREAADRLTGDTQPDFSNNGWRDDSARGRVHFWMVAVKMALDRPLTGVGYLGYNPSYDRYDSSDGEFGTKRSVHSAWFGVLAELGFPGLLLFAATLWLALIACHRTRRLARLGILDPEFAVYATGLETSLCVYAVGACFIPFQYVHMFWNLAGLTMAMEHIGREAVAARETATTALTAEALAPPPAFV